MGREQQQLEIRQSDVIALAVHIRALLLHYILEAYAGQ
jgi:hypothetical protein